MSKAEAKRQLILDETKTLLVGDGGAGLSMRKVADACAISLGNLQYHFATRELLLEALLASFIADYRQLLDAQDMQPTGSLRKDLATMLAGGLEALDTDEASRLFKELWAEAQHAPKMAEALDHYYRELSDFYAETLKTLCPSAGKSEMEAAVSLLMPLLEGYCITRKALPHDGKSLAKIWASAAADILERKAPPGP